ncbi:hypothetical protein GCM10011583_51280 [Streptomyces camponoticapitis]|uniref:Uncharacterized protein n=1 Tax=Streptomyces camponoticapitis TaxID=1616125 RepID=A0ABQ2EMD5_9ACTN|nr:hypothetical protein GCM10011583_51280 [Streptomyces camponoticapitis]
MIYLLLGWVALSLPVLASWYADRGRRLIRHVRSSTARLKARLVAALRRRLWRLLADRSAEENRDAPQGVPLHPGS